MRKTKREKREVAIMTMLANGGRGGGATSNDRKKRGFVQ
jgi:hypothetical protein